MLGPVFYKGMPKCLPVGVTDVATVGHMAYYHDLAATFVDHHCGAGARQVAWVYPVHAVDLHNIKWKREVAGSWW